MKYHAYIINLVFLFILNESTFAQPLSEKWGTKARETTVYIEAPVTDSNTGGVAISKGTGFIISKDGHILTANHIFKEWRKQSLSEKNINKIYGWVGGNTSTEKYPLKFIGDPNVAGDIALMKFSSPPKVFSRLPLCFYTNISEGSGVVAYGFPLGNDMQSTLGTLGNSNAPGGRYSIDNNFTYGMSGGPVLNQRGVIGIVKGGIDGEPAVRWVTPIRFSRPLVSMAPDFLECMLDGEHYTQSNNDENELLEFITSFVSFNGEITEDRIDLVCPEGLCKDYYYSETKPLLPTVLGNGEIRVPYRCDVIKKHCFKNIFSGKFDVGCNEVKRENPAEVTGKWDYNKEENKVSISSISFNGHQARNCGVSIVRRLNNLNGKTVE